MNIQEAIEQVDKTGSKTNIVLDATVLSTLMSCVRLLDLNFNHNLKSLKGKSNSLECGSILHKFMEVYYLCIINGIKKSDAIGFALTAAELYIKGCPTCTGFKPILGPDGEMINKPPCGHKVDDYPGVNNTPVESETYKTGWKFVLETCVQYAEFYKADHWVPLEVETVKGKVLYEDDEVRILWKAKLDLVVDTNQSILPMDHKSMKQRRDTLKTNNQFIGQCHVMGTRNIVINKVGFQKTLEPKERFTREIVSFSAPILLEWQSFILPYWAKMLMMYSESGVFPPNFSHCESKYGTCIYNDPVCTADPHMREENIKLNFYVGPAWNPTNEETD